MRHLHQIYDRLKLKQKEANQKKKKKKIIFYMNIFRSWLYISHFGFKAVLCICKINYAEDQFDWFLYCGKESCGKESFEAVTLRVRRQGQSLFLVKSIYSNIAVSTDGFSCVVATLRLFLSSASDWCVGRRLFSTCEIFFNKNPWGLRN